MDSAWDSSFSWLFFLFFNYGFKMLIDNMLWSIGLI